MHDTATGNLGRIIKQVPVCLCSGMFVGRVLSRLRLFGSRLPAGHCELT